jgi:hypothetical protein
VPEGLAGVADACGDRCDARSGILFDVTHIEDVAQSIAIQVAGRYQA